MTAPQWTPAPWMVLELDAGDIEITAESRDGFIPIATLQVGYEGAIEVEQQANADLLASAPELYDALQAVLAAMTIHKDRPNIVEVNQELFFAAWGDKVLPAIAKARGEP